MEIGKREVGMMRDKVRWRGGKKGMKVMGKEGKSGSHEKKKC